MSAFVKLMAFISRGRVLWQRASRSARREKSQRQEFYRTLWTQVAQEIGATVTKSQGELLCITRNQATTFVFRNYTDLDGPVTLRAAGNKPFVHEILREQGIPTPDFVSFSILKLGAALEFLKAHKKCVIKPAAGTGAGAGVTTGIETPRQLRKAAVRAAGYGSDLLVEKQVPGKNVRLLYLDGRLLDAIERQPPSVTGDGNSTVQRLVKKANDQRREKGTEVAQVFLRYDLDMQRTLAEQSLSWSAIPNAGQAVRLKTVINDNAAVENVSVIEQVCQEVVEVGREAARAIGSRLAGVDVVATDLSAPLSQPGGVVL
ncbi:MAG: hypothetical protein ACFCD0_01660 [Gemmataceae bacterium]